MANKPIKPETAAELSPELLTVEVLQVKCEVRKPVFAGVCAANGWRPGRVMTEEAFRKAVSDFTDAPMGAVRGKRG